MQNEQLSRYLSDRPAQISRAKENGRRIIGFFPGNYVPEELIYAAGAIPLCLNAGGDTPAAVSALEVVPHQICPFARAQIGERLLKRKPYYHMIDMLVAPVTCQHLKKVADIWEYYYDELEIFKLGIPHEYENEFEVEYYKIRLKMLKDKLEELTGSEITDEKLAGAIDLYNRMRRLLRGISRLRRASPPPVSAREFIELNHASFYADPVYMVDYLESLYRQLKERVEVEDDGSPRLLLIGPSIGDEDYQIIDLVSEAGGNIVIEEVCEGLRYCWNDIKPDNDLYRSLAEGYLVDRVPCAFMVNSSGKRLDFVLKLIEEYNVSGVIWYELLCCETYDTESYYFSRKLEERGIPMIVLEADYGSMDIGRSKVRVEALIEMVRGGME